MQRAFMGARHHDMASKLDREGRRVACWRSASAGHRPQDALQSGEYGQALPLTRGRALRRSSQRFYASVGEVFGSLRTRCGGRSRPALVLVADAPSAVRTGQTLDAQVLEGLATPDGTVQVRQASHARADPEIAARLADGGAISVGRALDADARCRRTDGPPAPRAVSAGLARRRAAM